MQTARKTATHPLASVECGAIFVSLELSRSIWLVTALATPVGSKMWRHQVRGGDMPGLLERFSDLQRNVQHRTGQIVPVIVIQEAGLDGFWVHRALVTAGIGSHVVDQPRSRFRAGIAAPRQTRSTERRLCARSWGGKGANHGSARWFAYRHRKKRIAGVSAGN